MNLLRKWVQCIFFIGTNGYWNFPVTRAIYKGPLKVVCSPGLNCYSCPASTTYCPIGALQQLFAGIRLSIETGQFYIGFYVIGTMGVMGGLVGRMICGWACPSSKSGGTFSAQVVYSCILYCLGCFAEPHAPLELSMPYSAR